MYILCIRKTHSVGEAVRTQILSHMAGTDANHTIILDGYLAILKTARAINNSYRSIYPIDTSSTI